MKKLYKNFRSMRPSVESMTPCGCPCPGCPDVFLFVGWPSMYTIDNYVDYKF